MVVAHLVCLSACNAAIDHPRDGGGDEPGTDGDVDSDADVDSDGDVDSDADVTSDADVDSDAEICEGRHLRMGTNVHSGTDDPHWLAETMAARHLTTARMDLWGLDTTYVERFRNAVIELEAQGIAVEAVLYDSYSRPYPGYMDCGADLAVVEENAYNEALTSVRRVDDLVFDFELQNEISLYQDIKVAGTTGQAAEDYAVPCGFLQAANLRGMSRAIVDERNSTHRPLRIILGTTDRSFGLLAFMEEQGVTFDVVGYHIYPWEHHRELDEDPWFGAGGPLTQLALFDRPIHINEFNCGEIYDEGYENSAGEPMTETCLRSITRHLTTIAMQTVANVESVHVYEILDEPRKDPPENRFGLLYDFTTPKVHLFLVSAFAGGALDSAEVSELTSRGLLTESQILAWSPCGAGPEM